MTISSRAELNGLVEFLAKQHDRKSYWLGAKIVGGTKKLIWEDEYMQFNDSVYNVTNLAPKDLCLELSLPQINVSILGVKDCLEHVVNSICQLSADRQIEALQTYFQLKFDFEKLNAKIKSIEKSLNASKTNLVDKFLTEFSKQAFLIQHLNEAVIYNQKKIKELQKISSIKQNLPIDHLPTTFKSKDDKHDEMAKAKGHYTKDDLILPKERGLSSFTVSWGFLSIVLVLLVLIQICLKRDQSLLVYVPKFCYSHHRI